MMLKKNPYFSFVTKTPYRAWLPNLSTPILSSIFGNFLTASSRKEKSSCIIHLLQSGSFQRGRTLPSRTLPPNGTTMHVGIEHAIRVIFDLSGNLYHFSSTGSACGRGMTTGCGSRKESWFMSCCL